MTTAVLDYDTTPLAMAKAARAYLLGNGGTQQELARNAVLLAKYEGERKAPVADTQIEEPVLGRGGNGDWTSHTRAPAKTTTDPQLELIAALMRKKLGIDIFAEDQKNGLVRLKALTVGQASGMISDLKKVNPTPHALKIAEQEAPKTAAPQPFLAEVHPGRYAVDGKIYRVTRGKLNSQWAGKTFVREEEAYRLVRGAEVAALLARIAADPLKYAREYFELTGRCTNCNRVLTNKISIEAAMGPICSGRIGGGKKSNESESEEVTTTANKRGLKAAAKQRTERHAQRTELPAKEEAREDRIRAAQERKRAAREAEDAAEQEAPGADETSKSGAKAAATRDYLAKHGWESAFCISEDMTPEEDVIELTARRTEGGITETLWVSWTKGVLTTTPMPTYTIADRTIKLRNVAELKRYSIRPAAEAHAEVDRVSQNKIFKPKATAPVRSKLPFDPGLATDAEIVSALMGKSVSWHNRHRETQETARVGTNPRKIYFTEYQGDRIFNFLCPQTGYRALRLPALMKVTR